MGSPIKVLRHLACLLIVLPGWAGAQGTSTFAASPPAKASQARQPGQIETDLRELIDARGLALLVEDDATARVLGKLMRKYQKQYAKLLSEDPALKRIDAQTRKTFKANLAGRRTPAGLLPKQVLAIPRDQMHRTLKLWIKGLFQRADIGFTSDVAGLSKDQAGAICTKAKALHTRKGLPSWRNRVLLWRWRDDEVKRLFTERDERLAFLTPVRIPAKALGEADRRRVVRTLGMLRNLKLQVARNKENPYETHRTLTGLLRGLRYMDTIREATRLTGLDHRMMTGLYIQESEFIHHRVSVAGAFSIAQFLNIAIKDIWLFRKKLRGSKTILKGIRSWEELKRRMIEDPRMAIKASCLYFRRVRDLVTTYMGAAARSADMVDLLAIEMFTARASLMEQSDEEAAARLEEAWPLRPTPPLRVAPVGGAVVPAPALLLNAWAERTVRDLARMHLSEQAFDRRLNQLLTALGIAAYNAGAGNLLKTAKRKRPLQSLSFPLQIDETRGYVDGILDAWAVLERTDRLASDVERMEYDELIDLADRVCARAGQGKSAVSKAK